MKTSMKWMSLLLVVLMLALSFAGCSSSSEKTPSNAGSSDTNTEDGSGNEASGDVLVMATNATFPPYEFYDGEDIVGIDAEIAAAIAEKLGMTLKIEDMDFNSIITAVNNGVADFGMAGMTVTPEREENVDFTVSYATGVQVVIVSEDSDIQTVDDLADKIIGVQLSTTGDIYATDDFGSDHVEQYNKGADAVIALKQGKVDAVIIDNEPAKAFVEQNEGLKILDTEYAVEDYAIAINKGNTELVDKVNTALQELIDDGTVQGIVDKYINAD